MTKPATLAAAGSSTNRTGKDLKTTIPAAPDKKTFTTLARRWRVLRLGCPSGCPLDHHEEPCRLAEAVNER